MPNKIRPMWEFEVIYLIVPIVCLLMIYLYFAWSNFLDYDYVQFINKDQQKCYYVNMTKEIWDLQSEIQWGKLKGKDMRQEQVRLNFIMALNSKTTDCVNVK